MGGWVGGRGVERVCVCVCVCVGGGGGGGGGSVILNITPKERGKNPLTKRIKGECKYVYTRRKARNNLRNNMTILTILVVDNPPHSMILLVAINLGPKDVARVPEVYVPHNLFHKSGIFSVCTDVQKYVFKRILLINWLRPEDAKIR